MKLSVIVPSIRPQGRQFLYDSIEKSFSGTWEIIYVAPDVITCHVGNEKYIESYRSPNAAQQQGLLEATGDYICAGSDDGEFLPGALDKAVKHVMLLEANDTLDENKENWYKNIIVGKYLEGNSPNPDMLKEDYYKFGYHKAYRLKGIPQDCMIFNTGIISRKFLLELGGYDAEFFDCTTIGHADLSIRAHNAGAKMIIMEDPLFKCSHQPGKTGDHKPIHESMKKDLRELKMTYSLPYERIIIPLDNWKNAPEKWRRFK